MKLTDNVIAIYDIDLDESIKEFKKEFNEISKQSDPTGTHTFTFSKYFIASLKEGGLSFNCVIV